MEFHKPQTIFFSALLCLSVTSVQGQIQKTASDQDKRKEAVSLFDQDKRLEALPLLEDLAQRNPSDNEILTDLAASLIDHATTLNDHEAAAEERFRARAILQRVWASGNPSPLAENLRQLLDELPANGAIEFSDNPAVQQIMLAGEAAFSRRDFEEARKRYAEASQLEPANYAAILFTGNTYDRQNDFDRARQCYKRAIALDPNIETAYRYYADLLAKRGDMTEARSMLIEAAVAEPYNKIVWREIRAWAIINKTAFNLVYLPIPLPPKEGQGVSRAASSDLTSVWQTYYAVRSKWQKGDRFQKQFPQEAGYRHSLAEESEALTASAEMLEKLQANKSTAGLVAVDPVAGLLLKLQDAGLIDPYVLFSLGDDDIAKDYVAYRAKNRAKLVTYMDRFVMPSLDAPAK